METVARCQVGANRMILLLFVNKNVHQAALQMNIHAQVDVMRLVALCRICAQLMVNARGSQFHSNADLFPGLTDINNFLHLIQNFNQHLTICVQLL